MPLLLLTVYRLQHVASLHVACRMNPDFTNLRVHPSLKLNRALDHHSPFLNVQLQHVAGVSSSVCKVRCAVRGEGGELL